MNITYVEDMLPMKKVLSIALIIVSPFVFLKSIFVGVFVFGIGLNMVARDGAQINLDNKTYRTIKSILGFHFGSWKPLPKFEYVSVFKTKESTDVNAYGATIGTFKSDIILLNVFYNGNKHITFYKTDDKADAFKVANHFKSALDIDILDATTSDKKWF